MTCEDPETTPETTPEPAGESGTADTRARAARRRRLAEIFGDVLPDQTGDDAGGSGSNDDRLRRDVPPHHGG